MSYRLAAGVSLCVVIAAFLCLLPGASAAAATPAPGFAVQEFATAFPDQNFGGAVIGPVGLAFDPADPQNLYVMDFATGVLYRFGPEGGAADAAHALNQGNPIGCGPAGIAFSKSGKLYVALQWCGEVAEVNKADGSIIRILGTRVQCATGLATDPLSGDLFLTGVCGAGGLWRISRFDDGQPGDVTTRYDDGRLGGVFDGVSIGPDGTIYLAASSPQRGVAQVAGTSASQPGLSRFIAPVPEADGIALAAAMDPSQPPYLFVNQNDGSIVRVDLTVDPPAITNVATDGSRGDFVTVGPDGCLYATQSDSILKVTNDDGSCSLAPVSPADATTLTYDGDTTGDFHDPATLAATLLDTTHPGPVAGRTITLAVGPDQCTAITDSTGRGSCSVVLGSAAGSSSASADYAGELAYQPAHTVAPFQVHQEETALTYTGANGQIQNGTDAVMSAVLLEDGSTPIAGASLAFTLGPQGCSAATDATGAASCTIAVAQPAGPTTAQVSFTGDADYLAATDSKPVTITDARPADMTINKVASTPRHLPLGSDIDYVIFIGNNGPGAAADVTLTDPLPSGTELRTATATRGSGCTIQNRTISCELGTFRRGDRTTVEIIVQATTPGRIKNTATVSTTSTDPNPNNNTGSWTTRIR
jgi:uncharacterized repeat protein (TIGR01451 family)